MSYSLPALGFAPDALEPFLSAETLAYHHDKHHRAYVEKLNALLPSSGLEQLALTEVVKRAGGALFDNAAQHFNHSFYWRCIAPSEGGEADGALLRAIERDFGSVDDLKSAFTTAATDHFGSGWCWLVEDGDGRLRVRTTSDAGCPVVDGQAPVLTCDVWEHAYYLDYRNDRARYVESFWEAVNWSFAGLALTRPADVEEAITGR